MSPTSPAPPHPTTVVPNASDAPDAPLHPDLMGQLGFLTDLSSFSLHDHPSAPDNHLLLPTVDAAAVGSPLRHRLTFRDPPASSSPVAGRPVVAMRFHTKFPNVLLCAHAPRPSPSPSPSPLPAPHPHHSTPASTATATATATAAGTVALWSLDDGRAALQRTLTAAVPLTALELFPISPTLVAAGTAVGSILLWDTRARSSLPLSVFDASSAALANDLREYHGRAPVTALRTTSGASPLFVSVSAAGHVCKWSLAHPDRPVAQTVLYDAAAEQLTFSAIDFPRSAHLFVADDPDGDTSPVHSTTRPSHRSRNRNRNRDSAAAPANHRAPPLFAATLDGHVARLDPAAALWAAPSSVHPRHDAPVTSLHAHPAGHRVAYLDDVIATASRDWTVRVWHLRRGQPVVQLQSFDLVADGAVFDAAWSPQHPSVLCAGDEAGVLSLFDVSERLAPPPDQPTWQFAPRDLPTRAAVRKVLWSADGKVVCAGDENGAVSVWATTSELAGLPDAEWMAQHFKGKAAENCASG